MLGDLWLRDEHCDRLCHISGVQRSVVRVGRVVARFNKTKERMAIGGIEAKVADQTKLMKQMEAKCRETVCHISGVQRN